MFLPESVMVVPDEAGLPATARRKTRTVQKAISVAASGRARTYGAGLKVLGAGM